MPRYEYVCGRGHVPKRGCNSEKHKAHPKDCRNYWRLHSVIHSHSYLILNGPRDQWTDWNSDRSFDRRGPLIGTMVLNSSWDRWIIGTWTWMAIDWFQLDSGGKFWKPSNFNVSHFKRSCRWGSSSCKGIPSKTGPLNGKRQTANVKRQTANGKRGFPFAAAVCRLPLRGAVSGGNWHSRFFQTKTCSTGLSLNLLKDLR